MSKILISIIGRPNVGKSTFFNRMVGKRKSIIDEQEGITRDRVYGQTEWCGVAIDLIDTGGYIFNDANEFNSLVRLQAEEAISESNFVLFMVDGKDGLTQTDKEISQIVRKSGKPYFCIVNKCDTLKSYTQKNSFYELGMKNAPFSISALNGRNSGDLLDMIIKELGLKHIHASRNTENVLGLSIVGMPNVGKSSLTNALLKKNRSIVSTTAGTTRDSIDASIKWYGKKINLIDTAGLRKLSKIKDKIEYYSTLRTKSAIFRSNIVLVLIDAEKGFTRQDKSIVDETIKVGKGLVLIINKWDLIKKNNDTIGKYIKSIKSQFKLIDYYPILFVSALTKQRINKVLEISWQVYQRMKTRIPTKVLNSKMIEILKLNPPPSQKGKNIKIKYVAQVSNEPNVIAFYLNYPSLVKTSYKRYLENSFRKHFDLEGVSIKLSFRKK